MSDQPRALPQKTLLLLGTLLIAAAIFCYEVYLPHPASSEPRQAVIAKGMGSRKIGAALKNQGIIRSKWAFVTYVTFRGTASLLKPGVYTFTRQSIADIAALLVLGGKNEKEITVPEGWTSRDVAAFLEKHQIGSAEEFRRMTAPAGLPHFEDRYSFLTEKPAPSGLEGYLFPDTYRIGEDTALVDVIYKMLDNFDRKLTPDLREEIARQKKSIFEIVTMASLIEKEVAGDDDRAVVSGILWKRLAADIPLQVDATIAYAKAQSPNYKLHTNGKISLADTKIDSPYNTYKYRGLPPGPIANPGLSAIRAAIYPKTSTYIYYLSASDGRTIFSRTLDEHNAAKARHLR